MTRFYRLELDDIIVVAHPSLGKIIKRIAEINEWGEYLVRGENSMSIAAEKIGWIKPEWILGEVKLLIKKK